MDQEARGTLESRYDTRVRELLESDPEAAVAYMLKAIPLIDEYTSEESSNDAAAAKKSHLDAFGFTVTATSSKNEVFCRYMAEVEEDYTFLHETRPKKKAGLRWHDSTDWICAECNATKIFDQTQAMMTCPGCGLTTPYIEMNHHNLSFDEQVSMEVSSHCAYKRVNHFGTWGWFYICLSLSIYSPSNTFSSLIAVSFLFFDLGLNGFLIPP